MRIGKVRHKNVRPAFRLQDAKHFGQQAFHILHMFQNASAVDLVNGPVGKERQALLKVRHDVDSLQVNLVDTDRAGFLSAAASDVDNDSLTACNNFV
ncbi:MAG: hypothetical protein IH624_05395 [Phycisphaerae bacterium]|nr:hypothetical protein [Phycisphaerae bacterium]